MATDRWRVAGVRQRVARGGRVAAAAEVVSRRVAEVRRRVARGGPVDCRGRVTFRNSCP